VHVEAKSRQFHVWWLFCHAAEQADIVFDDFTLQQAINDEMFTVCCELDEGYNPHRPLTAFNIRVVCPEMHSHGFDYWIVEWENEQGERRHAPTKRCYTPQQARVQLPVRIRPVIDSINNRSFSL
jgi:hypothetical protein